jgi:hypothetical protein
MRWLALIAVAEIKAVLGAERDIDVLVGVPVQVAKVEREGPVGIAFPAVKCGTYILAPVELGAARILDLSMQAGAACGKQEKGRANARSAQMLTQTSFHR